VPKRMSEAINEHIRHSLWVYILFLLVFLFGLFWGYGAPHSMDPSKAGELNTFVQKLVEGLPQSQIDSTLEMKNAFLFNGFLMLCLWFCGITVIGIPLTLPIIFYKGFSLGFSIGFLIGGQALKGFVIVLLTIIPQNIILVPLFFIGSMMAISFSLYLIRRPREGSGGIAKGFAKYCGRFALLFLGIGFCALLQGYLAPALLKLFFVLL